MKRLMLIPFVAGLLLVAGSTYAQTAPTATPLPKPVTAKTGTGVAIPDTNQLKQYVGTYSVDDANVKEIIVMVEGGRLVGEAVGLGQSILLPDLNTPDAFTIPDPNGGSDTYAAVQFSRDDVGKVKKVVLLVQGQTYAGTRTN